MYRHVLCVYPYRFQSSWSGFFPPLGLEIIATLLEPHARAIDVVDFRREPGRTTSELLRPDTDLVCFSVNWDLAPDFVRDEIRSVPAHVQTIVGGRHATEDPAKWLAECPNVDVVVRGDGEEVIEEIIRGRPLDEIAGISYRANGTVVHGPVRHPGAVSNDIYPNRRLRRHEYRATFYGHPAGFALDALASSRGCPFNCKFCSFNRNPWGGKRSWSARSPESVVRELEEIEAPVVAFTDDNFAHDMDRVGAICDLIAARGIRKQYIVAARVEVARRPDVLRKMERAGFAMLLIGIESARDKTLRSMNKGFNTRQLREHFRVLKRSSMMLHGYFMLGNIGESERDMLAISSFAHDLGLDTIALTTLHNERYTGLEELVAESPGYYIAPDGTIYSEEYPRERLRRIRHSVNRSFYGPGQMLRIVKKALRNGIFTPGMLARLPWRLLCGGIRRCWKRSRRA